MSLARNALAALAATGLALTPLAAQAAPVRTATPVEEADGFYESLGYEKSSIRLAREL